MELTSDREEREKHSTNTHTLEWEMTATGKNKATLREERVLALDHQERSPAEVQSSERGALSSRAFQAECKVMVTALHRVCGCWGTCAQWQQGAKRHRPTRQAARNSHLNLVILLLLWRRPLLPTSTTSGCWRAEHGHCPRYPELLSPLLSR